MKISQQPHFGELRITVQQHPTRYYKGYTGMMLMPENPGTLTYNGKPVNLDDQPAARQTLNRLEAAVAKKPADEKAFDTQARKGIREILDAVTSGLSVKHKPSFAHPKPFLAYYKDRLSNLIDSGESTQSKLAPPIYSLSTRA